MKSYYVVIPGGTPQGPFDEQTIKKGVADGTYPSSASVFCQGMTNWEPITAHFPVTPAPAPAPMPAPAPTPAAPAPTPAAPAPMPAAPAPMPAAPAPAPMPAAPAPVKYHVSAPGGQPVGPYSVEEIRAMILAGQLPQNSMAWNASLPNWIPVQQLLSSGSSYSFGQAISSCFKRYATFDGRASRSEYWWFYLFCVLLSFTYIGSLVTLIPSIAVAWRRMHDIGKHGAFCLIPIYGLILCFQESQPGPNQYGSGPNPPA